MAGDEAALPVAFEALVAFPAEPPDVNGKGGRLNGLEPVVLPESDPSRPGNVLLLPLEAEPDDGGAAEDAPELSPPAAGPIDSVSVPDSRPGKAPRD